MQCLIRLLQATLKPQVMQKRVKCLEHLLISHSTYYMEERMVPVLKSLWYYVHFFQFISLSTVNRLTLVKNIVDIDTRYVESCLYCKSTSRPCPRFFFSTPNPAESALQVMPIPSTKATYFSLSLHSVSSMTMVLSLMYLNRCWNKAILEYCGAVN